MTNSLRFEEQVRKVRENEESYEENEESYVTNL